MTRQPSIEHPLIETLQRVQQINEYLGMLRPSPEGAEWMPLQSLLAPSGETLVPLMARVAAHFKTESRRVPASLFFGDCAYVLMALACACYLQDHRVPRLTLDSVWLKFDEKGDVAGVALADYHFAALEDDPAAGHAECLVLPSEDALQDYLLEHAGACLQPLTQAVHAHSTLGIPAMWALAADYTSSATLYVGRAMQEEPRALELARQLAAKKTRLHRKRDFIHIEQCGASYELVDRISCCLYFQVEGGRYCSTCPHRPENERVKIIQEWLAQSAPVT